ncbi:MAG: 1-(5-phosphoribosyl)-5-[(5-phosphoribosylamino)methylideneamino] imidazole-4-carboxamide isomerase [Pseudomonadota bacterium]
MTTSTQIIPALDLKEGHCVRLTQGRFDTTEDFGDDPLALARAYVDGGARQLHLVDLDAAEGAGKNNSALIAHVARSLDVAVQTGGGLRATEDLTRLFDAGIQRAVIGSLAVSDPARVREWLSHFGSERVVLALDVESEAQPYLRIHGWQQETRSRLDDTLAEFTSHGLRHVLCTDISRDGMRSGPSIALYRSILARFPDVKLQASGGIRNAGDLAQLAHAGVPYAISGRALLEGTLRLEEVPA